MADITYLNYTSHINELSFYIFLFYYQIVWYHFYLIWGYLYITQTRVRYITDVTRHSNASIRRIRNTREIWFITNFSSSFCFVVISIVLCTLLLTIVASKGLVIKSNTPISYAFCMIPLDVSADKKVECTYYIYEW